MSAAGDALQARAEILKLARILETDPDELAYLEDVPVGDLVSLRDQTTEVLWNANASTLDRLAAASKLLPAGLTATISQTAFGPLLSARMAGRLEPERAVEIAKKLPVPFLADVAVLLDPRRASAVISLIPSGHVIDVTRELVVRREYVTMGRFVGHLTDGAVGAALATMDDASLLRVAFVMEEKERLEHLVGLLGAERLGGVVEAAAEEELWLEALDLLTHLSEETRREIVAVAPELDYAALEALLEVVAEHGLWEEVRVIAERDPKLQKELAKRGRAGG
jgi:hypothetical protein